MKAKEVGKMETLVKLGSLEHSGKEEVPVLAQDEELLLLLREAENNPSPRTTEKIYRFLEPLTPRDLLFLIKKNKEIWYRLSSERYEDYWENEIKKVPLTAPNVVNNQEIFLNPTHFMSSFEYMIGYLEYLFLIEDCAREEIEPQANKLLFIATQYHSFHALEQWIHIETVNLYPKLLRPKIDSILNVLKGEMFYHGTPGCLLTAMFFVHLCKAIRKYPSSALNAEEKQKVLQMSDMMLANALKYFEMGRLLENRSENEIHNAYFGEGLLASNPFHISTIPEMKKACAKLNPPLISSIIMSNIDNLASQELKQSYEDWKEKSKEDKNRVKTMLQNNHSFFTSCSRPTIRVTASQQAALLKESSSPAPI